MCLPKRPTNSIHLLFMFEKCSFNFSNTTKLWNRVGGPICSVMVSTLVQQVRDPGPESCSKPVLFTN